jgi:glycerol uptake operon antiterminator
LSGPLWIAVQANGNVKIFSIIYSIILLFNVPMTYLLYFIGYAPEWMLYARIFINIVGIIWELFYVRHLVDLNLKKYVKQVVWPITLITVVSVLLTYIVMDMFEGLGRDAAAVEFVSKFSPYGIISTRGNIIKHAKTLGLCTVQRFFIVDGQSVKTALETVRQTKPSYAELMPGLVYKAIQAFAEEKTPIIAGGLVSTEEEVSKALEAGAVAVSTSVKELYN